MNHLSKIFAKLAMFAFLFSCSNEEDRVKFCISSSNNFYSYLGSRGNKIEFMEYAGKQYIGYKMEGQAYPPHSDGITIPIEVTDSKFIVDRFFAMTSDNLTYKDAELSCVTVINYEQNTRDISCLTKDGRFTKFHWSYLSGISQFEVKFEDGVSEVYRSNSKIGLASGCRQ